MGLSRAVMKDYPERRELFFLAGWRMTGFSIFSRRGIALIGSGFLLGNGLSLLIRLVFYCRILGFSGPGKRNEIRRELDRYKQCEGREDVEENRLAFF